MSIVIWEKKDTVAVLTLNNRENRMNQDFADAMIQECAGMTFDAIILPGVMMKPVNGWEFKKKIREEYGLEGSPGYPVCGIVVCPGDCCNGKRYLSDTEGP